MSTFEWLHWIHLPARYDKLKIASEYSLQLTFMEDSGDYIALFMVWVNTFLATVMTL